MKKRDIVTLVILGSIFIIIFLIVIISGRNYENIKEQTEFNELTLLKDESTFMSITNNINRIFDYSDNNSRIFNLVVKNEPNIKDYSNISFNSKEIYVVSQVNKYKYYIKGTINVELMDEIPEYVRDEYILLNYDMENTTFNIEIIDKDRYNDAKNEKYIFENINNNDYNKFDYISLSPKSKAQLYFNNFLEKMYYSTEEAYTLLTTETKNTHFKTLDEFKSFISGIESLSIKEFSVEGDRIGIKDTNNNEYVFEISYILKYNVTIYKAEE